MAKRKGMNRYQKAAFRPGEHRTRQGDIEMLLTLAQSEDAEERCHAAQNLCPCHVRRRIDEVWQALYQMMEDPDVRVRRAAWHTLEDGGSPNDPAFLPILHRALHNETDPQVRRFAELFRSMQEEQETVALARAQAPRYSMRGRCDFCGTENAPVRRDFETEIAAVGSTQRHAWVCETCDVHEPGQ
ncbi:MAG TPA: HEAT repeat domain-containing protein [Caldilineaceae bacterium]|nr:HEAT repeat domain-containing protein [Caldilineaceae bacterium]